MLKAFCSFRSNVVLSHPDDVGGGRKEGVGRGGACPPRAVPCGAGDAAEAGGGGEGEEGRGGACHFFFCVGVSRNGIYQGGVET